MKYHQADTRATASDQGDLALDIKDLAELEVAVRHCVSCYSSKERQDKRKYLSSTYDDLFMEVACDVVVTILPQNWWGFG